MADREFGDYVQVREPYVLEDGSTLRYGEILHKDHPLVRMEFCEPVRVRHEIEAMTAEPGEKRSARVKR
jgi:hypothetical protein